MNEHHPIARHRRLVLVATLTSLGIAAPISPAEEPQSQAFLELPKVGLARSTAVEAAQDPATYWAGKVTALIETSEKTASPLEKAEIQLKAANLILGRVVEPFSSPAVAGLSQPSEDDKRKIQEDLAHAEKLLTSADELLKNQPDSAPTDASPPKGPDEEKPAEEPAKVEKAGADPKQLLHISETLHSFLNGIQACLLEADPSSRRRAASALAPLLEDSDKRVSAAAKVWQALLRGSDPSVALKILNNPMANPPAESWLFAIHAKVLRCRYQGMQGSWSSALVMLTYLEEQLDDWVPEAACRGDARRLFAWTRLDVLKRWYESLPPEREAERTWCVREAERTMKSYFGVETTLLRMEPAIPMLLPDEPLKAEPK